MKILTIGVLVAGFCHNIWASILLGNPTNFRDLIATLAAGDTLYLIPGNYSLSLRLTGIVGSPAQPILISGQPGQNKPVFLGNSCCNTVALRSCSYLHLRDIICHGQGISGIDAIKAEGGSGNECHHIEIEGFEITGYSASQQNVGISTKTPCWDWHVHHNVIDGVGTGMYFGNDNGQEPFANSIIEYNLIMNSVGYNAQVKHQDLNTRDLSIGMPASGKTIFRYNVFNKGANSSSGGLARPNLLVGNFPASGNGSTDYYEIYGNLFYQNPVEGLFQGTGNLAFYNNICYNSAGGWGIAIQTHIGFQPRDIDLFFNTVLVDGATGISLSGLNASFTQRVSANAVFALTPISGGSQSHNITDQFHLAGNYLKDVTGNLNEFDFSPSVNQLIIAGFNPNIFSQYIEYDRDFDAKPRDGSFAGAYHTDASPTWQLDLAIRNPVTPPISSNTQIYLEGSQISIFPCPANNIVQIEGLTGTYEINILDVNGSIYQNLNSSSGLINIDIQSLPAGIFFISLLNTSNSQLSIQKMIKGD